MIQILPEQATHFAEIRSVTEAAFSRTEYGHNGEAELIDSIRTACCDSCSAWVAIDRTGDATEHVVGHVMLSPARLDVGERSVSAAGLAPVSVAPEYQRRGIGSQLIERALLESDDAGIPAIFVIGDPAYYCRFGFVAAEDAGVRHGFEGIPQQFFQIRWRDSDLQHAAQGTKAWYHSAFGEQFPGEE